MLTSHDCTAKEFVSACFSPHQEKITIATLTCADGKKDSHGFGESQVIIWNWEKTRCQSLMIIPTNEDAIPNQVSFSINDQNVVVVTGKNTYRYYKEQDNHFMKV